MRLGGPQSRSERGGKEKNSQPQPGLKPPIIQPVAQRYTTELTRLVSNHWIMQSKTINSFFKILVNRYEKV
jgi:hypothetical protein